MIFRWPLLLLAPPVFFCFRRCSAYDAGLLRPCLLVSPHPLVLVCWVYCAFAANPKEPLMRPPAAPPLRQHSWTADVRDLVSTSPVMSFVALSHSRQARPGVWQADSAAAFYVGCPRRTPWGHRQRPAAAIYDTALRAGRLLPLSGGQFLPVHRRLCSRRCLTLSLLKPVSFSACRPAGEPMPACTAALAGRITPRRTTRGGAC